MRLDQPAIGRQFESWHMAFAQPPASELQKFSQASWEDAMPVTRSSIEKPIGLMLALDSGADGWLGATGPRSDGGSSPTPLRRRDDARVSGSATVVELQQHVTQRREPGGEAGQHAERVGERVGAFRAAADVHPRLQPFQADAERAQQQRHRHP